MYTIKLTTAALLAGVVGMTGVARAQDTYFVKYKTRDIADAGTDATIGFRIWGDDTYKIHGTKDLDVIYKRLGFAELKGKQDRGKTESFLSSYPDQGPCTYIQFKGIGGGLFPNDWVVESVEVTHLPTNAKSTFVLNKTVGSGESAWFVATSVENRPSELKTSGGLVRLDERIQVVKFFDNERASASPGATTTQEWSFGETVGFANATTQSFEASVTLTYSSPLTVAGSFGASATAAYSKAQTTEQERVSSQNYTQSLTLNWDLPERASILKVFNLDIPWEFQDYAYGESKLRMRKLGAKMQIAPLSGKAINIPNRDQNGQVIPTAWSEVKALLDIMARTAPADAKNIERDYKAHWIAQGWVFEGAAQPVTLASGVYKDNLGLFLKVDVRGATLSVENLSPEKMTSWSTASGKVVGNKIEDLRFVKGGNVAFIAGATIANDRRVEFGNGHWAFFSADIAAIPGAGARPGTTPTPVAEETDRDAPRGSSKPELKDLSFGELNQMAQELLPKAQRGDRAAIESLQAIGAEMQTRPESKELARRDPLTPTDESRDRDSGRGGSPGGSSLGLDINSLSLTELKSLEQKLRARVEGGNPELSGDLSQVQNRIAEIGRTQGGGAEERREDRQARAAARADLSAVFADAQRKAGTVKGWLKITNHGDAPASNFKVLMVASKNKQIDSSDIRIGAETVTETLLPGQSTYLTLSKHIDGSRLDGLKLIAAIDVDNQVEESSETNNLAVASRTFGKGIGFSRPDGDNSADHESADPKKGGKGGQGKDGKEENGKAKKGKGRSKGG